MRVATKVLHDIGVLQVSSTKSDLDGSGLFIGTLGAGTITRVRTRSSWQPGGSSCGSPDSRETRPHCTAPLRLRDTTVFLRRPQFSAAPTIAPVCQYSAKLRLPALGLEPGRFQTAYGAAPPRRTARRHRFARLSALEDPRLSSTSPITDSPNRADRLNRRVSKFTYPAWSHEPNVSPVYPTLHIFGAIEAYEYPRWLFINCNQRGANRQRAQIEWIELQSGAAPNVEACGRQVP